MAKKNSVDIAVLLALAKALKAKGQIDKIDMESKSFVEMLKKQLQAVGKDVSDELGGLG